MAGALRILARNKIGFLGLVVAATITVVAFVAPLLVPFDPSTNADAIYQGPSAAHWLGTDGQGRDVFRQVLNGGGSILVVGYLGGLFTTAAGLVVGALAGYLGGRVDGLLSWLADIVMTIPQFALLAVLAAFVRLDNSVQLALLLAVFGWPGLMRAVRSQVLSARREYVEAARSLGLKTSHIVFREIGPSMAGYIAVHLVLNITGAIFASVGLMFLGFVPIQGNNWGVMLNLAQTQGAIYTPDSVWYVMGPMLAIVIFQLALVSLQRSLAEVFDPRLRQRRRTRRG